MHSSSVTGTRVVGRSIGPTELWEREFSKRAVKDEVVENLSPIGDIPENESRLTGGVK